MEEIQAFWNTVDAAKCQKYIRHLQKVVPSSPWTQWSCNWLLKNPYILCTNSCFAVVMTIFNDNKKSSKQKWCAMYDVKYQIQQSIMFVRSRRTDRLPPCIWTTVVQILQVFFPELWKVREKCLLQFSKLCCWESRKILTSRHSTLAYNFGTKVNFSCKFDSKCPSSRFPFEITMMLNNTLLPVSVLGWSTGPNGSQCHCCVQLSSLISRSLQFINKALSSWRPGKGGGEAEEVGHGWLSLTK